MTLIFSYKIFPTERYKSSMILIMLNRRSTKLLPLLTILSCLSILNTSSASYGRKQNPAASVTGQDRGPGSLPAGADTDTEPAFGMGLDQEETLFQNFIQKFNKTYTRGSNEYSKRLQIFKESLLKHELLNAFATHRDHATYGITKFSDLTVEEFKSEYLGAIRTPDQNLSIPRPFQRPFKSVPSVYDLRSIKPSVVTPVRNQKSCGACWAFSVVETMETQIALKYKHLTELSVQELVDCGTAAGDGGCRGGVPCKTLHWLNQTKTSLVPESTYPYKAKKGDCRIIKNSTLNAVVSDFSCGNYTINEEVMPSMVYNHGPLSISVDAEAWQYYLGGIIQYHCTPSYLNHAVQIVGYDMSGDIPFYIVRNSWGADWGIDGYLKIKIGNNVCGVASAVQTISV
ncbi:cathepsin O-like [Lytechinus variegatus]|nr:cathepsin O-like [Lytechinus variegatus]